MSESHELYKKYLADKQKVENAKIRGSKYVRDYEKDAYISRTKWKEKDREEKYDNDRTDRLFGNVW